MTKHCRRCDTTKPISDFYRDSSRRDGLYVSCKSCHRERTDSWSQRNPAATKRYDRTSKARHREARRLREAERRARYPERVKAATLKWKATHRAHLTALEAVRRGRKAAAAGDASPAQIAARVAYYGGKCWMCGRPYEHIDHVIPLSRDGSNWPANLRPACSTCNSRKGSKLPKEMTAS